ncbi:MAG: ABC transporter permease [Treponema sp.]|nr:ABC transporter permease [Treponema sp.]
MKFLRLFKDIYAYREMILNLVKKDLRGRYKGSLFGFLWTFLNPLLQVMVYSVVFSFILRFGTDKFYLFLFVGMVPWLFFASSITTGAGVVQAEKNLVVKIHFPREVIPIYFVTSSFINMLLCFVIIIPLSLFSGVKFNLTAYLCLPIIMIIEYIIAMGACLIVSAVNVYFRDLQQITGIIAMAGQFFTPIMYPLSSVPENLQPIMMLNPLSSVIISYREVLYYGRIPRLDTLLYSFIFGIILLVIGFIIFGKLKRRFAEVL